MSFFEMMDMERLSANSEDDNSGPVCGDYESGGEMRRRDAQWRR